MDSWVNDWMPLGIFGLIVVLIVSRVM